MNEMMGFAAEGFLDGLRLAKDLFVLPFLALVVVARALVGAFVRHDSSERARVYVGLDRIRNGPTRRITPAAN